MAMQITNQADYALRSMLYIAQYGQNRLTPSNIIAEEMQISRIFLSRINSELVGAGLIKTRRGARGGIMLAKHPAEISIYDIVTTIDGKINLIHCTEDPDACPLVESCPYRKFWKKTEEIIITQLKSTTLQDMMDQAPKPA